MSPLPCCVLGVNKPSGPSSYDVIRGLKRVLEPGAVRIGHAGTLDPLASGVLLVLLGDATKLSSLLMASTKEYRAEVLLGRATDTDDVTGQAVESRPVPALDGAAVRDALSRFTGDVEQIPPAFSALKHRGQPLYALARQGTPVRPRARRVTVHRLELLDLSLPRMTILAEVSSGTYVRALCRDIARSLGTCGTLSGLVRTRSGSFRVEECAQPGDVTPAAVRGKARNVADALPELPKLPVPDETARLLAQGRRVAWPLAPDGQALAVTADLSFAALVSGAGSELACRRVVCNHGNGRS